MECLMQYLDDLEDVICALALAAGRIRRAAKSLLVLALSLAVQILIVLLALTQPPLALAVVSLLSVALLYRAVISHPGRAATTGQNRELWGQ